MFEGLIMPRNDKILCFKTVQTDNRKSYSIPIELSTVPLDVARYRFSNQKGHFNSTIYVVALRLRLEVESQSVVYVIIFHQGRRMYRNNNMSILSIN